MIAQVALTVICIPPAMGIAEESLRDRVIRGQFPAEEYLAARVALDREPAHGRWRRESAAAFAARLERTYARARTARRAGTRRRRRSRSATACPAWAPAVRSAEVEVTPGAAPIPSANLWMAARRARLLRGVRESDRGRPRLPRWRSRRGARSASS